MEKIGIISDVHGNITALNTVLEDMKNKNVSRIICLGDSVAKGANPDKVIDVLKDNCEVILIGNTDYGICNPSVKNKGYWSREKIGEERAEYIYNLPKMHEFYLSGYLVRLFHASPYNLDGIFNPMFSNKENSYKNLEIYNPEVLFHNTEFIGRAPDDEVPDIIGYGHIHTPLLVKFKNKTIFNTGSVGIPTEMLNMDPQDVTNKFSSLASYTILEGNYDSRDFGAISITQVRLPYDIEKEVEYVKNSDMPNKRNIILCLKTAMSEKNIFGSNVFYE